MLQMFSNKCCFECSINQKKKSEHFFFHYFQQKYYIKAQGQH